MTKSTGRMRAMFGAVLALALFAAPWPAAAMIKVLQAPNTRAIYHLAPKDTPVNVRLNGWYCRDNDLWSEIEDIAVRVDVGLHLDYQEGVMRAVRIQMKLIKMKAPGWPMTEPSMHGSPLKKGLDAPPGGRKVYKFKYCATKAELLTVRKTVMTYLTSVWEGTILVDGVQEKKFIEWSDGGFPFSHTLTVTIIRAAVPEGRKMSKPLWQPKDRSAGGRKRGLCNPAAARRAGALVEKLGQLRQAFLLEDDRKKKDEIARRMRATVKALAAVRKKIEENIKIEKQKCMEENRQAIKSIDGGTGLPAPVFRSDRIEKKTTTKTVCQFSKPRIVGQGRPGLAGLPKDFPRPPGIEKPWTFDVSRGAFYGIGISRGWKSTVSFIEKALPERGWQITRRTKTYSAGTKTDWVHIFFRNRAYCGWASIGATPRAPTPTSLNIGLEKRPGRVGGG